MISDTNQFLNRSECRFRGLRISGGYGLSILFLCRPSLQPSGLPSSRETEIPIQPCNMIPMSRSVSILRREF